MGPYPASAIASPPREMSGVACGLGAAAIWAGWMGVTRLGVTSSLDAFDITALRFATAGAVLLPLLLRKGLMLREIGPWRLLALIAGAGAPYTMVVAAGLKLAPAAQGAILVPGTIPLFVAALSAAIAGERFAAGRLAGYGLIVAGLTVTVLLPALRSGGISAAHLLFLSASLLWAVYTLVLRRTGIGALHAVAIVSVGSAVLYLPVYLAFRGFSAFAAPMRDVVLQAAYQGLGATVLALFLFSRAIAILGPSRGAAFIGLVPVLAALLAIPILGELPTARDCLGVALVSIGVYLASGGTLRRARR